MFSTPEYYSTEYYRFMRLLGGRSTTNEGAHSSLETTFAFFGRSLAY